MNPMYPNLFAYSFVPTTDPTMVHNADIVVFLDVAGTAPALIDLINLC
jgi:hypothetical protein